MAKEILIKVSPAEISMALVKNRRLIELHKEDADKSYSVGDIYLGRVSKIIPNLNAAFVDIGYDKGAFLHYLDLGPQIRSLLQFTQQLRSSARAGQTHDSTALPSAPSVGKEGKIGQILKRGMLIPVQIIKEPISLKGPRVSSNLSLAGRHLVLTPFSNSISISRKITSPKEKLRLKNLLGRLKPDDFGVIGRTALESKSEKEITEDLEDLRLKWDTFTNNLVLTQATQKVIGEMSSVTSLIRDILSSEFSAIHVNNASVYAEIKNYLNSISASDKLLKLYRGKIDIFEKFGVENQIKALFGKTINIRGGAYLVLEHTEALHVIDVNSGKRLLHGMNQEENALNVNLEAAKEVARQLRLRDMGGIIVVDFIDMQLAANKKALYVALKEAMKTDRAKHTILPPSKFGLIQITRQRVRPQTMVKTLEKCPTCNGTGDVRAALILEDEIEKALKYISQEQNEKRVTILVDKHLLPYFKGKLLAKPLLWSLKYKIWVKLRASRDVPLGKFVFLNKKNQKLHV